LLHLGERVAFEDFYQVVLSGRGQMPAFTHIDMRSLYNLYIFLGGTNTSPAAAANSALTKPKLPAGPVVASGPAPGTYDDAASSPRFRSWSATPYPEGSHAPAVRYTTGYGLGFPYIMRPPWSYLVAYDLNAGVIKWKVPVGQDRDAAREGGAHTGVPRGAQRNGMVVTSTGIVFSTAKDGHLYAFDADTGRTLWSADLGCGTEGLPAMYELDGRPYLVVNATTPLTWGRNSRESGIGANRTKDEGGYIVFSLPPQSRDPSDLEPRMDTNSHE
jgi:quinoprotein glucose dehydrogenase